MKYAKALDDLLALRDHIGPDTSPAQYAAGLKLVSEEFYALNRFEKNYGFQICGSEPGPRSN